jgi:hypothetical protein
MLAIRLFATLGLSLWLIGAATFPVAAQGNETGTGQTADEGTPPDGGNATGNSTGGSTDQPTETPPATGTLTVHAYLCTSGGDPGTGVIFAQGDFSPDDACTATTATITIDGGDAAKVDGSADFPLAAGTHSLVDTTTGATHDVDVAAGAATTVSVVAYAAPKKGSQPTPTGEAETAAAPASTTIHLIKHDCAPSIQTADDFKALTANQKLMVCPVITLPNDAGADGAVHGTPAAFDFSFDTGTGTPQTLTGNATFTKDPAPACESTLGDVDGKPNNNLCFDASYYVVTVQGGPVTITETTAPDKHRFGAVELPDTNDAATLDANNVDVAAGKFVLDPTHDTSGDNTLVVHVYNFSPPRVTVVVHDCPDTVKTTADFAALGNFAAKLKGCPVVTRNGDDGPADAVNGGGHADVRVSVVGADATEHKISQATFVPAKVCESDLGADLDGGDPADLCLDVSGYAYNDVAQGGVTVTETKFPADYALGAAETDPAHDAPPATVDVQKGTVALDTSTDGEVTLHLFNFTSAAGGNTGGNQTGGGNNSGGNSSGGNTSGGNDTGGNTGGNTTDGNTTGGNQTGGGNDTGGKSTSGDGSGIGADTGGGAGTLDIYTLYCQTSSDYTDIQVFSPGEEVDPNSLGDDTCITGTNEYQITEFGRNDLGPVEADANGFAEVTNLPSTAGQDPHLITETASGEAQPFEIETGITTTVVVLVWQSDFSGVASSDTSSDPSGDTSGDVSTVTDGSDLPDTGVGSIPRPDGGLVLLLGMTGFLVLGGAYRLRRVPNR